MKKSIAILATMDTKGAECNYLRDEIIRLDCEPILIDIGVLEDPNIDVSVSANQIVVLGGSTLAGLRENPTREIASEVMVLGASTILKTMIESGEVHGVIGLGGTQGTANCTQVMQSLNYGFPKLMVSTMASGDTSGYVGIKDITMMFSVSDILGLNPFFRSILSNAAGAICGMAMSARPIEFNPDKPVIGITNLGVLTQGTIRAMDKFREHGFETMVFHAVGSGGTAMEQLMRDGIIQAVFDFALGDITDALCGGIRAASADRLTVAGELGLPQVIVPGGTDHIGVLVDKPGYVPPEYSDRKYTFHNPVIFVPRTSAQELSNLAKNIASRLGDAKHATFMIPLRGVSSYSVDGGKLQDVDSDRSFLSDLHSNIKQPIIEVDASAESQEFIDRSVDELLRLISEKQGA